MNPKHESLFQPIKIGGVEINNRYVMEPMASFGLVDAGGVLTDDGIEYFVERARGGIGLIMTGTCFVDDQVERIVSKTLMCTPSTDLWLEMQQFNKLAERIHAYGGKIFIQLASGYGRSAHVPESAREAVAPSEIPNRWDPSIIHRAMTVDEIHRIVDMFGEAAAFCKKCGIDGVEVHAVHEGYLLDQFTSEFFNHRTDEYGGSFENRYRFAMEVCESIKKACGKDFPVSLRFTLKHCIKGLLDGAVEGEEYTEVGRDTEEGLKAAKYLTQPGYYDALNVDLGCYDAHYWNHPSVFQKDALYLEAAALVKKEVSVPVIAAGRMDDPDLGAKALEDGLCDMIGLARPSLADPEIPNKVATDRISEIRPCISCNYGCCTKVHLDSGRAGCAVNAQCAYELSKEMHPAMEKKNIVVIGGGPAGCEFARVATLRGHSVTLFEKEAGLGGAVVSASKADFKHHDRLYIAYFENELKRLGVTVKYNTEATPELVAELKPDMVVAATGAKEWFPPMEGAEHAVTAVNVLMNPDQVGEQIVILGAGQVGVETGIWMLQRGKKVTIVELTDRFMPASLYSDMEHAQALIKFYGGKVLMSTKAKSIAADAVTVELPDGTEQVIPSDTTIFATGFRADDSVFKEMRKHFPLVYNIGDSVRSRNIYAAVHEAYELATHV